MNEIDALVKKNGSLVINRLFRIAWSLLTMDCVFKIKEKRGTFLCCEQKKTPLPNEGGGCM